MFLQLQNQDNQISHRHLHHPFYQSYLDNLFEFTGDGDDGGFILAYVTQDGRPLIQCKIGSQIVEMGLRKALERFLDDMGLGEKALSEDNPS